MLIKNIYDYLFCNIQHSEDIFCPSFIAANNLVYLTGRMSRKPSIHATPLNQFFSPSPPSNGTSPSSWPKFSINLQTQTQTQTQPLTESRSRSQSPLEAPPDITTNIANIRIINTSTSTVTHAISERFTASGIAMQVSLRQPTWLDLERARRQDPTIMSMAIIDLAIYWTRSFFRKEIRDRSRGDILGGKNSEPKSAARYFKLALCTHRRERDRNRDPLNVEANSSSEEEEEEREIEDLTREEEEEEEKEKDKPDSKEDAGFTWTFRPLETPVTVNRGEDEHRSVPPSIHGRMLHPRYTDAFINLKENGLGPTKMTAVSLVNTEVRTKALEHLNGKKIIFSFMDYYSGAVLFVTQSKIISEPEPEPESESTATSPGSESKPKSKSTVKYEISHVLELYN